MRNQFLPAVVRDGVAAGLTGPAARVAFNGGHADDVDRYKVQPTALCTFDEFCGCRVKWNVGSTRSAIVNDSDVLARLRSKYKWSRLTPAEHAYFRAFRTVLGAVPAADVPAFYIATAVHVSRYFYDGDRYVAIIAAVGSEAEAESRRYPGDPFDALPRVIADIVAQGHDDNSARAVFAVYRTPDEPADEPPAPDAVDLSEDDVDDKVAEESVAPAALAGPQAAAASDGAVRGYSAWAADPEGDGAAGREASAPAAPDAASSPAAVPHPPEDFVQVYFESVGAAKAARAAAADTATVVAPLEAVVRPSLYVTRPRVKLPRSDALAAYARQLGVDPIYIAGGESNVHNRTRLDFSCATHTAMTHVSSFLRRAARARVTVHGLMAKDMRQLFPDYTVQYSCSYPALSGAQAMRSLDVAHAALAYHYGDSACPASSSECTCDVFGATALCGACAAPVHVVVNRGEPCARVLRRLFGDDRAVLAVFVVLNVSHTHDTHLHVRDDGSAEVTATRRVSTEFELDYFGAQAVVDVITDVPCVAQGLCDVQHSFAVDAGVVQRSVVKRWGVYSAVAYTLVTAQAPLTLMTPPEKSPAVVLPAAGEVRHDVGGTVVVVPAHGRLLLSADIVSLYNSSTAPTEPALRRLASYVRNSNGSKEQPAVLDATVTSCVRAKASATAAENAVIRSVVDSPLGQAAYAPSVGSISSSRSALELLNRVAARVRGASARAIQHENDMLDAGRPCVTSVVGNALEGAAAAFNSLVVGARAAGVPASPVSPAPAAVGGQNVGGRAALPPARPSTPPACGSRPPDPAPSPAGSAFLPSAPAALPAPSAARPAAPEPATIPEAAARAVDRVGLGVRLAREQAGFNTPVAQFLVMFLVFLTGCFFVALFTDGQVATFYDVVSGPYRAWLGEASLTDQVLQALHQLPVVGGFVPTGRFIRAARGWAVFSGLLMFALFAAAVFVESFPQYRAAYVVFFCPLVEETVVTVLGVARPAIFAYEAYPLWLQGRNFEINVKLCIHIVLWAVNHNLGWFAAVIVHFVYNTIAIGSEFEASLAAAPFMLRRSARVSPAVVATNGEAADLLSTAESEVADALGGWSGDVGAKQHLGTFSRPAPRGARLPASHQHHPTPPTNLAAKRGSVRDERSRTGPWLRTIVVAYRPCFFSPSTDSALERALGGPPRIAWTSAGRASFREALRACLPHASTTPSETIGEYVSRPGRSTGQRRAMLAAIDALAGIFSEGYVRSRRGLATLIAKSELLLKNFSPTANNRAIQFPDTAEAVVAGPEAARLLRVLAAGLAAVGVDIVVGYSKEQTAAVHSRNCLGRTPLTADGAKADAQVSLEDYTAYARFAQACGAPRHFLAAVDRYSSLVFDASGMRYSLDGSLASGTPITSSFQTFRHALAGVAIVRALAARGHPGARVMAYSDDLQIYAPDGCPSNVVRAVADAAARSVNVVLEFATRVSFCSAVFVPCTPHDVTMPDGARLPTEHHMVPNPVRVLMRSGYTFKGCPGSSTDLDAAREAADLARANASAPLLRDYYSAVARVGGVNVTLPPVDPVEYESTMALFGYTPEFAESFRGVLDAAKSFPWVVSVEGFEHYAYDAATEAGAYADGLPVARPPAPACAPQPLAPDHVIKASAQRDAVRTAAASGGLPPARRADISGSVLVTETAGLALSPAAPAVVSHGRDGEAAIPASSWAMLGLMAALLLFTTFSALPPLPAPSSPLPTSFFNATSLTFTVDFSGSMVRVHVERSSPAQPRGPAPGKGRAATAGPQRTVRRPQITAPPSRPRGAAAGATEAAFRSMRSTVLADSGARASERVSGPALLRRGEAAAIDAADLQAYAMLSPMDAPPGARPAIAHGFPCATATFPMSSTFVSTAVAGGRHRLAIEWGPGLVNAFRVGVINATTGAIDSFADIADPFLSFATTSVQGWQCAGNGLELSALAPILDISGEVVALYQPVGEWAAGAWPAATVRNSRYADTFSVADMRASGKFGLIWRPYSPDYAVEFVAPSSRVPNGRVLILYEGTQPMELLAKGIKHVVFSPVSAASIGIELAAVTPSAARVTAIVDAVNDEIGSVSPPDILEQTSDLVKKIVGVVKTAVPLGKRIATGVSSLFGFARSLLGDAHVHAVMGPLAAAWYRDRMYPPPRCVVNEDGPAVVRAVMSAEGTLASFDFDAWQSGRMDLEALAQLHSDLVAGGAAGLAPVLHAAVVAALERFNASEPHRDARAYAPLTAAVSFAPSASTVAPSLAGGPSEAAARALAALRRGPATGWVTLAGGRDD